MKEATRFLIAFFLFPHLMCFPRSKFARLTAELADVRVWGKKLLCTISHFGLTRFILDSVIVVVVAAVVVVGSSR